MSRFSDTGKNQRSVALGLGLSNPGKASSRPAATALAVDPRSHCHTPLAPAYVDTFRAFSTAHVLAATALALLIFIWIFFARKVPASVHPTLFERVLAWSNLMIWFAAHLWWIIPPALDLRTTLPLQLCHIASVMASVVLLTRKRWARTLVYFWGIGLSTQAILTPSLTDPPGSIWFWGFWQQHGFLLAVALHDYFVRGYRPDWQDFRTACFFTFGYFLAILPVNLLLGANYGFVGNSAPGTPSIVDLLGPWPGRLAVIIGLVFGVFLILLLAGRNRSTQPISHKPNASIPLKKI